MAQGAVRLMAITETGSHVHIVALTDIQANEIGVMTLCGLMVAPRLLVDLETPLCNCARCLASLPKYGLRIGYTNAREKQ
jgi:hypothetical protein